MGYLTKTPKITEKAMKKAVLYASTIASFNVEGFGLAKTANLTMTAVHKRMRKFCRYITP